MLGIDVILLVLWGIGTILGWMKGLVRQVVSIVGLLAGLVLARMCYGVLGDVLSPHLNGHTTMAGVLAFSIIWLVVPTVLSLVGEVVSTVLDKLFVLGTVNRLLGAVVGFFKWMFVLGALVWILSLVGAISSATMQESLLCQPLKKVPESVIQAFSSDAGNAADEAPKEPQSDIRTV